MKRIRIAFIVFTLRSEFGKMKKISLKMMIE